MPEMPGLLNGSVEGGAAIKSVPLSSVNESIFDCPSLKLTMVPCAGAYLTETVTPGFQQ